MAVYDKRKEIESYARVLEHESGEQVLKIGDYQDQNNPDKSMFLPFKKQKKQIPCGTEVRITKYRVSKNKSVIVLVIIADEESSRRGEQLYDIRDKYGFGK